MIASSDLQAMSSAVVDLIGEAEQRFGFRADAIRAEVLLEEVRSRVGRGVDPAAWVDSLRAGDPDAAEALALSVSVGETYFFRHAEQLQELEPLLPGLAASGVLRAWSAGCATGEEAWTLAAWAKQRLGPAVWVEVLGTDLLEQALVRARAGRYRRWSLRASGPQLAPVLAADRDGYAVLPELRASCTFHQHNLLDAPPHGAAAFDLVLCRNVLPYLREAAVRRAVDHLCAAVRPGGVLVFGPVDAPAALPGFDRVGPPELQLFRRRSEVACAVSSCAGAHAQSASEAQPDRVDTASRPAAVTSAVSAWSPASPNRAASDSGESACVARHVAALALLEDGDAPGAARVLRALASAHPAYLPARFELALCLNRLGEPRAAREEMRSVFHATRPLPADQWIEGPEPMTASFYREAAAAFLSREPAR